MTEAPLFSRAGVVVTRDTISADGLTIQASSVSGVRVRRKSGNVGGIAFGVLMLLLAIPMVVYATKSRANNDALKPAAAFIALGGVSLLVAMRMNVRHDVFVIVSGAEKRLATIPDAQAPVIEDLQKAIATASSRH